MSSSPSVGFRNHYISSGARGVLSAIATIYSSSLFVADIGADFYSKLIFFFFIMGAVLYGVFLFSSVLATHRIYLGSVVILFFSTLALFFDRHNHLYIYAFAIFSLILDTFAVNVVTAVLPTYKLSLFRDVYQKMMARDLLGRIFGSAVMIGLSRWGHLEFFYPIAWISLGVHVVSQFLVDRDYAKNGAPAKENRGIGQTLALSRQSILFIFKDSLVATALIGIIWARVAKFCVENVYLITVNASIPDVSRISSFISWTSLGIIAVSFLFQQSLLPKLNRRLPLSALFGLLPLGATFFAAIGLGYSSLITITALYAFFKCLLETLFFPTFRNCLLPAPQRLRQSIFSWVILMSLVVNIFVTGVLSQLKGSWSTPQFLGLLIFVSVILLYFASRLDSFYIRNLWGVFKESRQLEGEDMAFNYESEPTNPLLEEDYAFALTDLGQALKLLKDERVENEQASLNVIEYLEKFKSQAYERAKIIKGLYGHSYSKAILQRTTDFVKGLLKSPHHQDEFQGLQLISDVGLPQMNPYIVRFLKSPHEEMRKTAQASLEIRQLILKEPSLSKLSIEAKKTVREMLLQLEGEKREHLFKKISWLSQNQKQGAFENWLKALHSSTDEVKNLFLKMVPEHSQNQAMDPLSVAQILYFRVFKEGETVRQFLLILDRKSLDLTATQKLLSKYLEELSREGFNIWKPNELLNAFMTTLFLTEWMEDSMGKFPGALSTVLEFEKADDKEKSLLTDIHLECLKRRGDFPVWERFFKSPS